MNKTSYKCCFCDKTFTGYGNNPDCWDDRVWKLSDRCCDDCNSKIVVPSRIKAMYSKKEEH